MTRFCITMIAVLMAHAFLAPTATEAISIKPVALSFQQAPGFPEGVIYYKAPDSPGEPSLDDAGRVVYKFGTLDTTNLQQNPWWRTGPQGEHAALVFSPLSPAPGASDFQHVGPSNMRVSVGNLAFSSVLKLGDNSQAAQAVFVGEPGDIRLAAISGVPTDLLGGGTFELLQLGSRLRMNGTQTVFNGRAHLNSNPEITHGLWLASSEGTVQTLALEGGAFNFTFDPKGIDETGRVGFQNDQRLYIGTPGDVRPAAYTGLVGTSTYTGSGAWLFTDSANTRIHTLHPNGTLRIIATKNAQAADMPAGVTYKSLGNTGVSRSGDNVFFRAALIGNGINDTSAFSAFARVNGSTRMISRPGMPAPDLPGLVLDLFGTAVINDTGQMVFTSGLAGPGVDTSNDDAMWYDAGDGVLHLVMRTGAPFTFNGETRTLQTFYFGGGSNGGSGADSFNNAGQFTASLKFTDGSSGVFLFQIPEPACGIVLLAMVGMSRQRCSRRKR